MKKYYVNKQAQINGDHEVHVEGCYWMPNQINLYYLGEHVSCVTAVTATKKIFQQVNGCVHCCNSCHTQ